LSRKKAVNLLFGETGDVMNNYRAKIYDESKMVIENPGYPGKGESGR